MVTELQVSSYRQLKINDDLQISKKHYSFNVKFPIKVITFDLKCGLVFCAEH